MLESLLNLFTKLRTSETGATAIEYGLIAALVGVALLVSLTALSDALVETFEAVAVSLTDATS